jgi:hypothetical protein
MNCSAIWSIHTLASRSTPLRVLPIMEPESDTQTSIAWIIGELPAKAALLLLIPRGNGVPTPADRQLWPELKRRVHGDDRTPRCRCGSGGPVTGRRRQRCRRDLASAREVPLEQGDLAAQTEPNGDSDSHRVDGQTWHYRSVPPTRPPVRLPRVDVCLAAEEPLRLGCPLPVSVAVRSTRPTWSLAAQPVRCPGSSG